MRITGGSRPHNRGGGRQRLRQETPPCLLCSMAASVVAIEPKWGFSNSLPVVVGPRGCGCVRRFLPPRVARERSSCATASCRSRQHHCPLRSGFLACSGRPPSPAPFWFRFRLHVQNARLGSAPAADPGNVLASVHQLKGQDVPSGGILAGEQPGRSRGAAVSRSGRST